MSDKLLIKQFTSAIRRNDIDETRRLLITEPVARESVNAPLFAFDAQPVIQAKNNPAMIDLLLEYGADINAKTKWWAGGWGVLDGTDSAAAEFLISRGALVDIFAAAHLNRFDRVCELLDADPELIHARGGDGCRPLHFAGSVEMIDLLLSRGAEIDARDVDHEATAAQWLIMPHQSKSPMSCVRELVSRGARVDVFMLAALNDAGRLRTLLNTDPALMDHRVGETLYPDCPAAPGEHIYVYKFGRGMTAAEIAAAYESAEALQLLVSRSTPRQKFLLACGNGDRFTAEKMLREKQDLVQSLLPEDHGRLAKAAWNGNTTAVRLMLDVGFNPLAMGPDTGTALHCAAWQGQIEIVRMILSHAATRANVAELINAVEPAHQNTPLGWCCHGSTMSGNKQGNFAEVATLLRDAGATPASNLADASDAVRAALS